MEYGEAIDLVREEDLEIWLSIGFVIQGSQRSFLEIREMIEEYFKPKRGEKLIHGTASGSKLYIVKEKDYELLQSMKQQ